MVDDRHQRKGSLDLLRCGRPLDIPCLGISEEQNGGKMKKFSLMVLGFALFIGIYAAVTADWIAVVGAFGIIVYFILNPYELD